MNKLTIFNKEVIPVYVTDTGEKIVIGRELHTRLKIETPYRKWFPRMCEYGFTEGIDYTPDFFVHPQNGQEITDHYLKFDMAKHISMIQRTPEGKEIRQRLIDLEEAWNSPDQVMARALKLADQRIHLLEQTVNEQRPKVEFFDAVADSKTAIEMAAVAKVLAIPGYGRNNLFEFLREQKVLQDDNVPYQKHIDAGRFRVIEQKYTKPDGTTNISIKTLVYQKGVDYIRRLVESEIQSHHGNSFNINIA